MGGLEEALKKISIQHSHLLDKCLNKLAKEDKVYKEFRANLEEELGGMYGPQVMVHRGEEGDAKECWKMNFLLIYPND